MWDFRHLCVPISLRCHTVTVKEELYHCHERGENREWGKEGKGGLPSPADYIMENWDCIIFFQSLGCPTGQWSSKKSGPATEMEKGFNEVKGKFRAEPTQGGQLISAKRTEKIRGDKHAHGWLTLDPDPKLMKSKKLINWMSHRHEEGEFETGCSLPASRKLWSIRKYVFLYKAILFDLLLKRKTRKSL